MIAYGQAVGIDFDFHGTVDAHLLDLALSGGEKARRRR